MFIFVQKSTTTSKQLREQTTFITNSVKGVKAQPESTYSSVTDKHIRVEMTFIMNDV